MVAPAQESEEAKPRLKQFWVTLTFTGVTEVTRECAREASLLAHSKTLREGGVI